MKLYQVTLKGFDGTKEAINTHTKWIISPSREALDAHIVKAGIESDGGCPTTLDNFDHYSLGADYSIDWEGDVIPIGPR